MTRTKAVRIITVRQSRSERLDAIADDIPINRTRSWYEVSASILDTMLNVAVKGRGTVALSLPDSLY